MEVYEPLGRRDPREGNDQDDLCDNGGAAEKGDPAETPPSAGTSSISHPLSTRARRRFLRPFGIEVCDDRRRRRLNFFCWVAQRPIHQTMDTSVPQSASHRLPDHHWYQSACARPCLPAQNGHPHPVPRIGTFPHPPHEHRHSVRERLLFSVELRGGLFVPHMLRTGRIRVPVQGMLSIRLLFPPSLPTRHLPFSSCVLLGGCRLVRHSRFLP